jgi:hypothetical protein
MFVLAVSSFYFGDVFMVIMMFFMNVLNRRVVDNFLIFLVLKF